VKPIIQHICNAITLTQKLQVADNSGSIQLKIIYRSGLEIFCAK